MTCHLQNQEALNMVNPAMQLATKIPDIHIQLWASAVLKGELSVVMIVNSVLVSTYVN